MMDCTEFQRLCNSVASDMDIASDGLFDMIDDNTIAANASSGNRLIDLALIEGGFDNTPVIFLQFTPYINLPID